MKSIFSLIRSIKCSTPNFPSSLLAEWIVERDLYDALESGKIAAAAKGGISALTHALP